MHIIGAQRGRQGDRAQRIVVTEHRSRQVRDIGIEGEIEAWQSRAKLQAAIQIAFGFAVRRVAKIGGSDFRGQASENARDLAIVHPIGTGQAETGEFRGGGEGPFVNPKKIVAAA